MSRSKYTASIAALLIAASGCIKNDIPYPRIQPNITEFEVAHASQSADIDSLTRNITVYLEEDADIYNVQITHLALSQGELCDSAILRQPIDLSTPYPIDVRLYQTYTWTVKAVQDIQREFVVQNQIGAAVIDVPGHRVIAYVPNTMGVAAVKVETLKLGSPNAVMTPDLNGKTVDFTIPVEVNVNDYGRNTVWTIYVETTEASVTTSHVDAWSNVAWLYGEAEAGKDNGFEYRLEGTDTWVRVPDEWVSHDGGNFTARLIHLMSESTYEARAFSDNEYGVAISFTTQPTAQLPNSSMDNWWLDGKVWCPWAEGGTPYWDTGNKGAATLGQSNSVPTDDTSSGTGHAAMLESRFVGIGSIGKLAAGNIFVGSFVRTDGTNGILSMGREFNLRPTRLTGYMKYKTAPISSVSAGFEDLKGRPDTCAIWIALIDTDEPFEIRTNPKNRQLFDPDGAYVVAYGALNIGHDVPDYVEFEVTLNYKSTSRKPKYILCAASASKLGDYFTGGNGAVLYVDDFQLQYDY